MTASRRIYRDSKGHFRKRTIQEGALELVDKLIGSQIKGQWEKSGIYMKPSAQSATQRPAGAH